MVATSVAVSDTPTTAAAPAASDVQHDPATPVLSIVTGTAPLVVVPQNVATANLAPPTTVAATNPAPTTTVAATNPAPTTTVVTTNPAQANPVPPANAVNTVGGKWFSVTRGHQVGVFQSWFVVMLFRTSLVFTISVRLTVAPLVNGVPGSVYNKYPSEAAARTAYDQALAAGNVHPY
jgi:hypothetical protein